MYLFFSYFYILFYNNNNNKYLILFFFMLTRNITTFEPPPSSLSLLKSKVVNFLISKLKKSHSCWNSWMFFCRLSYSKNIKCCWNCSFYDDRMCTDRNWMRNWVWIQKGSHFACWFLGGAQNQVENRCVILMRCVKKMRQLWHFKTMAIHTTVVKCLRFC